MISCIIIEDQAPAQRILKRYIKDFGELDLKAIFTNAIDALEFLKNQSVDLIFLDIHLPKLSGMDFLNIVQPKPYVILTTAFQDYAIKSYELEVSDYLLKPFSFDRFIKAVYKVQKQMNLPSKNLETAPEEKSVLIKSGYDYIHIKEDDILFIKSEGDYSFVYASNKKYLASDSLKHWEETLNQKNFVRVHKSYMVNVTKLDKVGSSNIEIGEHLIPVGRVYKKSFLERIRL